MNRILAVAGIVAAGTLFQAALAQTKPAPAKARPTGNPPADAAEMAAHAAHLEEMRALAAKLSFEEPGVKPALRHTVVEEPLLHFTSSDRGFFDGTLWAYGHEARPVAFVEMYCGKGVNVPYRHATTGTCDRPLKLLGAPTIEWTPQSSAIAWAELKTDNVPADKPALRLRQMKALAARFSAYQIFEPTMQREELRLLVQPLRRYHDAKNKIRDGVVFAFVLGTNPEALLFIEARDDASGTAAWQYGWARRGTAGSVHGFLDEVEVWSVKRLFKVTPNDPHVHFLRSINGNPVLDTAS